MGCSCSALSKKKASSKEKTGSDLKLKEGGGSEKGAEKKLAEGSNRGAKKSANNQIGGVGKNVVKGNAPAAGRLLKRKKSTLVATTL